MTRKNIFEYLYLAIFVVVLSAIAILTIGPFAGAESQLGLSDKEAHFLAFYALTAAGFASLKRLRRIDIACGAVAIGALIEIVQTFVGRSGSLLDLTADALGAAFCVLPTYLRALGSVAVRRNTDHLNIELSTRT